MQTPSPSRRHNNTHGRYAEWGAAVLLTLKGYRILAHRWKHPVGEIDLIARRGKTLVFVEVKARRSEREALEAVTPHQRRRIEQSASVYVQHFPRHADCAYRFDVVACFPPLRIRHLMDAWRPL